MENKEDNILDKEKNGISKNVNLSILDWSESITVLDISEKDIVDLTNVRFPPNLLNLNLSGNKLKEVPRSVLELSNLKMLDLSNNNINYFYDTPKSCHTIEQLNLANNNLKALPYWLWIEFPKKLLQLNLSHNIHITKSIDDVLIKDLLEYKVLVTDLKIYNCRLTNHIKLLETFQNLRILEIGHIGMRFSVNCIDNIPCKGLDKLCDIQRLNLSNTQICQVLPSIDMYKNLVEINLSHNYLRNLPKSFCNLEKLKVCILSYNKLLYLPENMSELKQLVALYLDSNELCMLPDKICELPALQILDLYDNSLYEVPEEISNMQQIDLALNYFDPPHDEEYVEKKHKLRLNNVERCDKRKVEIIKSDSEPSPNVSDDDLDQSIKTSDRDSTSQNRDMSSPEDWDSDEYWIPHYDKQSNHRHHSQWEYFVKRKIEEGNFVPIDQHLPSIVDTVKYMKLCNPQTEYESDGQFDDYSEDDS